MKKLALVVSLVALSAAAHAERYTTSRSIRTSDSPGRAARVVSNMRTGDALRFGAAPPGVSARQTGPGSFEGRSPVATVNARISVRSDGGRGSIVTEHVSARSPLPGGGAAAGVIHGVATSLSQAYDRASSRTPRR
jgi:hypothetical protein